MRTSKIKIKKCGELQEREMQGRASDVTKAVSWKRLTGVGMKHCISKKGVIQQDGSDEKQREAKEALQNDPARILQAKQMLTDFSPEGEEVGWLAKNGGGFLPVSNLQLVQKSKRYCPPHK